MKVRKVQTDPPLSPFVNCCVTCSGDSDDHQRIPSKAIHPLTARVPLFRPLNLRLTKWFSEIAHPDEPRSRLHFVLGLEHHIAGVLQTHFDVPVQHRSVSLCQVEDAAK